jgi:hypothetical protein
VISLVFSEVGNIVVTSIELYVVSNPRPSWLYGVVAENYHIHFSEHVGIEDTTFVTLGISINFGVNLSFDPKLERGTIRRSWQNLLESQLVD